MPDDERKLDRLEKLLKVANEDTVSFKQLGLFFKKLADIIKDVKVELANDVVVSQQDIKQLLSSELLKSSKNVEEFENRLLGEIKRNRKESDSRLDNVVKQFTTEVNNIHNSIPPETDLSEIEAKVAEVKTLIPKLPEPDMAEDVRNKLEVLTGDERLGRKAISGLEKLIKEMILKHAPRQLGGRGGGHTDMGVQHSLGRLVKTETPTGTIDGANTAFTTTQPIFAVTSYMLNGEVVGSVNYTIAGNKITWGTAPPAAYSGKDHEIIYF